jgi:hypothetical protein
MKGVTIRLLAVWLAAASVVSAQDRNAVIMPRTRQAPVPDGRLADPCWAQALSIDGFTQPMSETAPVQRVQARLCFDDEALYVALICFERAPQTIRSSQREKDVYLDDCVELWIRSTGDAAEYDQFLVNAISTVELARQRAQGGAEHIRPAAKAGSRIERDRWVCELAIPFGDLGRAEPLLPGEFLEMKIGREDYAGLDTPGQPTLAIWPPRVRYGGS